MLRAYVRCGLDGMEPAGAEKEDLARVRELWAARPVRGEGAEAAGEVVRGFTRALFELNQTAWLEQEEARETREQPHVMAPGEHLMKERHDDAYCRLAATWCTPGRVAGLSSVSSLSDHHSVRLCVTGVHTAEDGDGYEVWTHTAPAPGWATDAVRLYRVVACDGRWFVNAWFQVWDRGEPDEERIELG